MMHLFVAAGLAALMSVSMVQTRDRGGSAAAATGTAATLGAGWNALAAGQRDAAVRAADSILQQRPWDHAAMLLKLHALSAGSADAALLVYDQWLVAHHTDDLGLLEPVAIATLREIAKSGDATLRHDALSALAAGKVEGAEPPPAATEAGGAGLDRDLAAARAGDPAALQRLSEMADPRQHPRNAALAANLTAAGPAAEPALVAMLGSADGETRAAAARSLGVLRSGAARATLQKLESDPDPRVRLNATVALAKLGDSAALTSVDRLLAGGVPEVQLVAAETWEGQPGPWVEAIRPLLDNPDGLTRIQAARLIAPVDPEAARRTLEAAASDNNPVMRAEAASALTSLASSTTGVDVPTLRRRLHDRDPLVRLTSARALLKLAQS